MNLAPSADVIPWYAGTIEVREYLKQVNQESKTESLFRVLEYSLFQPGLLLDYLDRSPKSVEHSSTVPTLVGFDKGTAIAAKRTRDTPMAYTSVEDIANVVVRAVDFEGEWPVVAGFRGNMLSVADLVGIGAAVRGKQFQVDLLEAEDLDAGVWKMDNFARISPPAAPREQVDAWSRMATIGLLQSMERGCWDISNEWNQILPDLEFVKADEFLGKT